MSFGGGGGGGGETDAQKHARESNEEQFAWNKKVYADDLARQLAEAEKARQQEEERQNRISTGLAKVDKLFTPFDKETGTYIGNNLVTANKAGSRYFLEGDKGKHGPRVVQRKDGVWVNAATGDVVAGKKAQPKDFTNYYDRLKTKYVSAYLPDIDKQYADAKEENLFSLARSGIVDSSAAATASGDLAEQYGNQRLALKQRANEYANTAKGNADTRRSQLVNQVYSTADPTTVSAQGVITGEKALNFNADPAQFITPAMDYSPLGQLFTTAITGLNAYNNAQAYNPGGGNTVSAFLQRKTNEGKNVS